MNLQINMLWINVVSDTFVILISIIRIYVIKKIVYFEENCNDKLEGFRSVKFFIYTFIIYCFVADVRVFRDKRFPLRVYA